MRINCPQCGTDIPAGDVNLENLVARCLACNEIFGVGDRLGKASGRKRSVKEAVPRPRGVQIIPSAGGLTMRRRWWSPAVLFLVVFCLFWDGFLVFWYYHAFAQNAPLIMKIFPLIHAAVGVALTWFTLACLVNRTTVRVDYDRLTVRHGPVPWPGGRTIPAPELSQLYCEESVHRDKDGDVTRRYVVMAITHEGKKVKLLAVDDLDQARFMEQEIERFLDIEDRPVKGEA